MTTEFVDECVVGTGKVNHDHCPGLPEFVDECVVGKEMVDHDH